jgi:hypothetical protein
MQTAYGGLRINTAAQQLGVKTPSGAALRELRAG